MLRRASVLSLIKRGGGHDHPDFPAMANYRYKRHISPFENSIWVYDGANPEYLVDFMAPQYQLGTLVYRNLLFAGILPIIVAYILINIINNYFPRPLVPMYCNNDNDPLKKFLKKVKHESVIKNLKPPLGHNISYTAEGWSTSPSHFILNRYKVNT
jgi:hypothetical protein